MPSRRRHYRVTFEDACAAHETALTFGGLPGIRREADILSAIGRPYSGYHRPIHRKAAALFQAIATNHGFNDGNKRTAVLLTTVLIERSGYQLRPYRREDLDRELTTLALSVVERRLDLEGAAEWFRLRCRPSRR